MVVPPPYCPACCLTLPADLPPAPWFPFSHCPPPPTPPLFYSAPPPQPLLPSKSHLPAVPTLSCPPPLSRSDPVATSPLLLLPRGWGSLQVSADVTPSKLNGNEHNRGTLLSTRCLVLSLYLARPGRASAPLCHAMPLPCYAPSSPRM